MTGQELPRLWTGGCFGAWAGTVLVAPSEGASMAGPDGAKAPLVDGGQEPTWRAEGRTDPPTPQGRGEGTWLVAPR